MQKLFHKLFNQTQETQQKEKIMNEHELEIVRDGWIKALSVDPRIDRTEDGKVDFSGIVEWGLSLSTAHTYGDIDAVHIYTYASDIQSQGPEYVSFDLHRNLID